MSAATLICEAQKDGLRLTLTPSRTIKLTGPKEVAEKWAPRLREHKAAIVESLAANDEATTENYDAQEAAKFWDGFIDRVNECDRLIHELCDIRGDDQARRDDLIRTRQRMAPNNIDGDIKYLREEIALLTPTPSPEPQRDCRDCEHHRERNNNAVRYCVSPDGAAQRNDALASPITDCTLATHCQAFKSAGGVPGCKVLPRVSLIRGETISQKY